MNNEKRLPDETVEGVAGGRDPYAADFEAFKLLNCTNCYFGKLRACYYSCNNRDQAFKEFGSKPDAVCTHKRVI